jgi:large subunit ribosomal protein L22
MAEDEQEQKPRRRRRRAKEDPATPAPEASGTPEEAAEPETPSAPADEVDPTPAQDEVEPTPADEDAEDAAADVVLEAEAEIDEDSEPVAEAQAPKRGRRRRAAAEPSAAEPKAPRRPAPARRRAAKRDPSLPPPVVRAQAKYVRSSARKARLVCDHIRGKSVQDARAILAHTPRAVARDWSKLLESAVANAENNHELVGDDLYVKAVHADEGPTIKRFRPRAMGRATRIRKRTAHLTILLTPKE